jgi:hypothetical protein
MIFGLQQKVDSKNDCCGVFVMAILLAFIGMFIFGAVKLYSDRKIIFLSITLFSLLHRLGMHFSFIHRFEGILFSNMDHRWTWVAFERCQFRSQQNFQIPPWCMDFESSL